MSCGFASLSDARNIPFQCFCLMPVHSKPCGIHGLFDGQCTTAGVTEPCTGCCRHKAWLLAHNLDVSSVSCGPLSVNSRVVVVEDVNAKPRKLICESSKSKLEGCSMKFEVLEEIGVHKGGMLPGWKGGLLKTSWNGFDLRFAA